jgi:hypothetical protein
MANLGMTFDPDQVPQDEFENPPDNRYLVQAVESDVMEKDGGVRIIWYQMEILEGQLERRQFRVWMDLVNPGSPVKEKIGNQDFGKLCNAAGTGPVSDSNELLHVPMYVTLKTSKGYQNMSKAEPYSTAPQPAQRTYQQPAAAANNGAAMPSNGGQRRWGNRQASA